MPDRMGGLWLEKGQVHYRDDLQWPPVGPGEALVRVERAGICGTDLQLQRGYYGFCGIPGHEFVGTISEAPSAPQRVGETVVGEINVACGRCPECKARRKSHCRRRTVLGILDRPGAFADYLTLPLVNLHPVPESVALDEAVFTEPLAAALRISQQLALLPEQRVLVIGAGRLGMLIAQTIALSGCDLTVVVRREKQRRLLESTTAHCCREAEVEQAAYDVVVEATGAHQGFRQARRAVRCGGTILLKSTYVDQPSIDLSALVVDEIRLLGSRCGPFLPALRLLQEGSIQTRPLVDARYPLAQGPQAFEHASRPGVLKVLLDIGNSSFH